MEHVRLRARFPVNIVLGVVIAAMSLVTSSGPVSASQHDTTSTTTPSAPRQCDEGVTFKRLKRGKPRTIVVKATVANIRELPGLGCPILRSVERGTRLNATGRRARSDKAVWLEVRGSKRATGWVYEGLVKDA